MTLALCWELLPHHPRKASRRQTVVAARGSSGGDKESGWLESVTDAVTDAYSSATAAVSKAVQSVNGKGGSDGGDAGGSSDDDQESSWLEAVTDSVTGAVSDVYSGANDAVSNAAKSVTGGAPQGEKKEPGWFDQFTDYVSDKVDEAAEWWEGDDKGNDEGSEEQESEEEQLIKSVMGFMGDDDEGEEIAATEDDKGADDDETEDDPWWDAMVAVDHRAQTLQMNMNSLLLASKPDETQEMKFVDPQKQALTTISSALNSQCANIKGSWDQLSESEHADWVLEFEYQADVLESEMQQYSGDVEAYEGKLSEKLAIVARAIKPLQNQVITQEAILKYDQQQVEKLKQALANQKLVAQVNVAMGLFSAAVALTPAGIIGTGMSILQLGTSPSATGGVEVGSEVANGINSCIAKSAQVHSKIAGGIGAVGTAAG